MLCFKIFLKYYCSSLFCYNNVIFKGTISKVSYRAVPDIVIFYIIARTSNYLFEMVLIFRDCGFYIKSMQLLLLQKMLSLTVKRNS